METKTALTLFANDVKTAPRLESDLLMAWVSFRRFPSLPESLRRSLPAKSTKFNEPKIKYKEIYFYI